MALSVFPALSHYTLNPHMLLNSSGDPPSHRVLPSQILRSSYLEALDATRSSYGLQPQLGPDSAVMGVVTVQRDELPTTIGPEVISQEAALYFSSWMGLLCLVI